MITTDHPRIRRRGARRRTFATTLLLLGALAAGRPPHATAQEALALPFIGDNHLAFYTTELSRDGIGEERAAIFGAVYGRRFGDRTGPLEASFVLRAGARALDSEDGILDAGASFAVTRSAPGVERLGLTASAGAGVVAWGGSPEGQESVETGRLSLRVPFSAGASYEVRAGRATIAPFAAVTTIWSRERDYVDDVAVASDAGWRVGRALGVSVRFQELVLSLSDLDHERGMPTAHRFVFSAGMSW